MTRAAVQACAGDESATTTLAEANTAAALAAEARRLSTLRTQMLDAHPFWGYLLLQVDLIPSVALPTLAATDCVRRIWYNPLRTRGLSFAQLGFVLAHEVHHQVLASRDRCRGRHRHLWNCATDYAINRNVSAITRPVGDHREPMYQAPPGALDDDAFDGLIAEAIYEQVVEKALPRQRRVSVVLPAGGHGADDGGGEQGGADITLTGIEDHGGGIDLHLPGHLGEADRAELDRRIAGAVETWRSTGGRGHIPGDVIADVERRRGRVPWRRLFRQYAGEALARDEYSMSRPDRRYLEAGFIVPGLRSEGVGHVVVALDTSASMDRDMLSTVAAEITLIAREAGETTLIVADAEVQEVVPFRALDRYLRRGKFRGGGGTDHRPVFDCIRERQMAPDLFIGLTDLHTELPERAPGYPVVWVTPEERGAAAWGRVVVVCPEPPPL